MTKVYACEINGKKYIAIHELLGWNMYKVVGRDTMSTTPSRGVKMSQCKIWECEDANRMAKQYLQLKEFMYAV